jgi:selenocysteine lyase/cysteine desulfurase
MIDVDRARSDTPGSQSRTHLDNARASLMPLPVLAAMQEHLELEAQVGSAEAAEQQAEAIDRAYRSAATLVNADPDEITIYSGGSLDLMAQAEPHVVDVSRAIGRTPVDVQSLDQAAVVATAGSYLRGPAGAGILVLRGGRRARVNPSPAVVLGLGRAIEYAGAWGLSAIKARVDALAASLHSDLSALPGVSARADDGIVVFEVATRDSRDVAWALRKRGITVGLNGKGVRVSPHYFNTEHELEQLAATIRDL